MMTRNIDKYIYPNTVKLIVTSPPYANILNRKDTIKANEVILENEQFGKVEQYIR